MSKAKSEQTPSEVVAATVQTASHIDAKGRRITVKRLNALQLYRLAKLPGASSNPAAQDMATIVCTVTKIDAEPVAFPTNERDVEFLIQRLDFEGIAAAAEALKKLSEGDDAEMDAAKN